MPIKRRTPSKKTPSSGGARRVVAPTRTAAPRFLSQDEKRQLILAHAAVRQPADPMQRFSLWAGVAVCFIFVVGAWVYTVGSGIQNTFAKQPDATWQHVVQSAKGFNATPGLGTSQGPDLTEALNNVSVKLSDLAAAPTSSDLGQSASTTSSDVNDIFKPVQTATGTNTLPISPPKHRK